MQKLIIFIFVLTLFGCGDNNSNSDKPATNTTATTKFPAMPLIIENGEEDGWGGDLKLSITDIQENDTAKIYKAISTHEGKNVGLLVTVPKAKEKNKGFAGGFILASLGKESDDLLATLASVYKQKADSSIQFINSISLNYVNLGEFAKSLGGKESGSKNASAEYKLFFQGDEDYAELYLNVNPEEHWIELKEKDEEYRPAIIKFLRK